MRLTRPCGSGQPTRNSDSSKHPLRHTPFVVLAAVLGATSCHRATVELPGEPSLLITNVSIVDGSGRPARPGSVRIAGARIRAVEYGRASSVRAGERVVDGQG